MKKYVPRSIQNIFDRVEAFNESITEKLFSEELATTFEVVIYTSLTPQTERVVDPNASDSTSVSNYYFYSARSKAGHHDHLVLPESARTNDEYEKFRNAHFQAIIKKSSAILPKHGDVWLATHNGGNVVTLASFQRSGRIFTDFSERSPARDAHTSGEEPTSTTGDYTPSSSATGGLDTSGYTEEELKDINERGCKPLSKPMSIGAGAANFITKIKASPSFAGFSAPVLAGVVANAQAESVYDPHAKGDWISGYKISSAAKKAKVDTRNIDGACSWGYWQLNICDGAGTELANKKGIDLTSTAGKEEWKRKLKEDDEFQFAFVAEKIKKITDINGTDPYAASYDITTKFEKPACKFLKANERAHLAVKIYNTFKTELES